MLGDELTTGLVEASADMLAGWLAGWLANSSAMQFLNAVVGATVILTLQRLFHQSLLLHRYAIRSPHWATPLPEKLGIPYDTPVVDLLHQTIELLEKAGHDATVQPGSMW